MKPSLKSLPFVIVVLIIMFVLTAEFGRFTTRAQGWPRLQAPFSGVYRITSYLDHETPHENDGNMVVFNGEQYFDCPTADQAWTTQGPYCYDSHSGVDWAMPENTPVLVTAPGTVARVDVDESYGNFVRINHGNGYDTLYAHLKNSSVSVDDMVDTGDEIGRSGNTGTVGHHLHFEVRHSHNQRATDPFGWRGDTPDPLINYSGEAALCLWANGWCNETIVEDGDNSNDGTIKFQEVGSDWDVNNWSNQGNSWTMKYLPSDPIGSSYGVYWPRLARPGPYEVVAFIPSLHHSAVVTYLIHAENTDFARTLNQASAIYNERNSQT